MRIWGCAAVLILCIGGCSTNRVMSYFDQPERNVEIYQDQLFPASKEIIIESEQDIFELPTPAKRFIDDYILSFRDPNVQVNKLVESLFSRQQIGMVYTNEANTVAKETYFSAEANCLSLTILAYAFADYAHFDTKFQLINIPENWVRRNDRSLLNGHINVKMRAKPEKDNLVTLNFGNVYTEVDFDRPKQSYTKVGISKKRVVAMFYNNKGADFLLKEHYTSAYAYFKAALQKDPEFVPALINLGAVYRLFGKYDIAEQVYARAIHLDPNNLNNLENLAILKEYSGKFNQAKEIRKLINNRRHSNPYFHLIKGQEAYDEGDFASALTELHTAVRLDNRIHEVYFALAKTYYKLGDLDRSAANLKLAKRNSFSQSQRNGYQGKLELLTRNSVQ